MSIALIITFQPMEQHALKNVNNCTNTNIYSYLETSGGQSSNPYLNVDHFLTPEPIRNQWQLKTDVFPHWCLICAIPMSQIYDEIVFRFTRLSCHVYFPEMKAFKTENIYYRLLKINAQLC